MPQQDGVLAGVGAAGVVRHRARADLRHGDHPGAAPRARAHLQAAAQGAVQLRGPAQTGELASYFFIRIAHMYAVKVESPHLGKQGGHGDDQMVLPP